MRLNIPIRGSVGRRFVVRHAFRQITTDTSGVSASDTRSFFFTRFNVSFFAHLIKGSNKTVSKQRWAENDTFIRVEEPRR